MDMPGGWKNIAKAVIEARKWELEDPDRISTFDCKVWAGDLNILLSLMKEMAEALERYEVHMNEDHSGAFTYEDEVLKKFKEWK